MPYKCLVCKSSGWPIRRLPDDPSGRSIQIVKCRSCRLEYFHPMPGDEDLLRFYSQYADFRADQEARRRTARLLIKRLSRWGVNKSRRLLDFGCGRNPFIQAAGCAKWRGYDQYAEMQPGMIADYHAQPWDAITLWGVIEHLPRPCPTVSDLVDALKPRGVLAMTGPWVEARIPCQYKYEHVSYWTRSAVEILFDRCGLRLIEFGTREMIQKSDIYLACVLRTVPPRLRRKINHQLPDFVRVPTNEFFAVGRKV
jgi:hypothetical protein